MSEAFYLKFHDVSVEIKSQHLSFLNFFKSYFKPICTENPTKTDLTIHFEIKNSNELINKKRQLIEESKSVKLARNIWSTEDGVLITDLLHLPDLNLLFQLQQDKMNVYGFFEQKSDVKNLIIRKLYKNDYELKIHLILKYYLILFPIIWYIENFQRRYLIHASALKYNDKGLIFPGLGGVGKSTFVLSLMNNQKFLFISDNLIFIGNGNIYSCHESVALDSRSLNFLGEAESVLENIEIPMTHDRSYYRVKERNVESATTNSIIFIKFALSNYIRPVSQIETFNKIIAINSIAKEVQQYITISSILNLVYNPEAISQKYEALKASVSDLSSFEMGIKYGENPQNFIKKIEDLEI